MNVEEAIMNDQIASPQTPVPEEPALRPAVDVIEDAGGITLRADLPGVSKEALDIRVDGDTLTLEAQISLPLPEEVAPHHVEVELPRYRRRFSLSRELDAEQISAELAHGVLTLRIPKAEHAQPRKIAVAVG